MNRKHVTLLGIRVISTSRERLLARIVNLLSYNRKFSLFTINPELVLLAEGDHKLTRVINASDLPVPDGVGLGYASEFLYGRQLSIIPGRKLFLDIIGLANKRDWKVFFLGGEGTEAQKAAEKLRLNYKKVKIEIFSGPKLDVTGHPASEADKDLEAEAIKRINGFRPQMLFVAFGMPKQELWIARNLESLGVGGAMAVGGTFRYIAGLSKLPPDLLASLGLEWLWRLFTEPRRAKRVFSASLVFPFKVLWYKLTRTF